MTLQNRIPVSNLRFGTEAPSPDRENMPIAARTGETPVAGTGTKHQLRAGSNWAAGSLPSVLAFFAIASCLLAPTASARNKPLAGYRSLVVEEFTIEQGAATENFPAGLEVEIQQGAIRRLRNKRVFVEVIDGSREQEAESGLAGSAESNRRAILSGAVIEYKQGSRLKRKLIGFGSGATKIKMRFVVRDAATGGELTTFDHKGSFSCNFCFMGGGKGKAEGEASGDVVDGVVKKIRKNR